MTKSTFISLYHNEDDYVRDYVTILSLNFPSNRVCIPNKAEN